MVTKVNSTVINSTNSTVNNASYLGGTPAANFPSISSFASSISTTGYQKLPSGLILQWGTASVNNSTQNTFAMTFPTAVLSITCTWNSSSPSRGIEITTRTSSYFVCKEGGGGTATGSTCYYMAIGY